jgi:hypothetical protein
MAKKQTKKVEVEEPYVEETVVEAPIPEPQPIVEKVKKDTWEIKDRVYYLTNNRSPLTYLIRGSNIFWFDEEKGYERELKYCSNQRTCFVDEMKGEQRLEHIIFQNGSLHVPKNKTVLQKLLSLYHPHNGSLFREHKPKEVAASQISILELEVDALMAAREIDLDIAEAVMRVEVGSSVDKMSSKELKRDTLLFAKRNPRLFLELVEDDNVMLRNFGIKAKEAGILALSNDQRTFSWKSTGRKLFTVPFEEHPYTALAHWFKTDEGMEIYANIEKRLK